jgi:hypothetical protein
LNTLTFKGVIIPEIPKVWAPLGRAVGPLGGQVIFMEDIFILNEIWAQDINMYFGRHFACFKYEACYIV